MDEMRKDFLTGAYVYIAEERANRPQHFKYPDVAHGGFGKSLCPFCPGNEHLLPDISYQSKDRRIRFIPNMYPGVSLPDGLHEVVIDTGEHNQGLQEFGNDHLQALFASIQNRMRHFYQNSEHDFQYVQVFKNHGHMAGASIHHSHWQIMALRELPKKQMGLQRRLKEYYLLQGRGYIEDQIGHKALLVWENQHFAAYCPYASLYNFCVHMAPLKRYGHLYDLDAVAIQAMGGLLKLVLSALAKMMPGLSYNICIQEAPKGLYPYAHLFIEIIPRMGMMAGFEFSTGCYINSTPPEKAAEKLRFEIRKIVEGGLE